MGPPQGPMPGPGPGFGFEDAMGMGLGLQGMPGQLGGFNMEVQPPPPEIGGGMEFGAFPCVKLRGLPFAVNEGDIFSFLVGGRRRLLALFLFFLDPGLCCCWGNPC